MRPRDIKKLLITTAGIMAVSLILSSCTGGDAAPTETLQPPIEASIDQVYADYVANQAAADAKYMGQRLLFTRVRVKSLQSIYVNPSAVESYVMSGSVKFIAISSEDLEFISEGWVLDIVGEVQGFSAVMGVLTMKDCSFQISVQEPVLPEKIPQDQDFPEDYGYYD